MHQQTQCEIAQSETTLKRKQNKHKREITLNKNKINKQTSP